MDEHDHKRNSQNKDWQRVDSRILGQILAAQNILFVLPDQAKIAEYFSQALIGVPGVASCFICLGNIPAPGKDSSQVCNKCATLRKKEEGSFSLPSHFICGFAEKPDMFIIRVGTNENTFGFFVFKIDSDDVFEPYSPFLHNLADYIALSLENRAQKLLLERSHNELENRVKERTEQLRQLNERFSLAANASHLGIWDWDIQKNELVWDNGMYALYGINKEDFTDVYGDWLKCVHPDDRARTNEMINLAQLGKQEYDTEFRVVWPNGNIRYLKAFGQIVRDTDGTPLRMTGINLDITERKQVELEILTLNTELEQRVTERTAQLEMVNKELEAFSYSVSHDLRAPLRGIDGFSQALIEDYKDKLDEQGMNYLNRVRSAAQRMSKLIDDMLSLSRVNRRDISITKVNLSKMFRKIAADLHETQPERKIKFVIQKGITVMGDDRMLQIVLENLIRNAWKFTSKHPKACIEFGMRQQKEMLVYFITDDGAGFDMDYSQNLFVAFQRLHTSDEFPGTGIGLAIVQRVIHRLGGNIWAEGAVEKGATFYFTIP